MIIRVLSLLCCFGLISGLVEGDFCDKDGQRGTCVNFKNCQSALEDVKQKNKPQICAFQGANPIVCCLNNVQPGPSATTSISPLSSTTQYTPPEYDYMEPNIYAEECEPIPTMLTSPKTGQKAWDKCVEYQEKYVFPCERSETTGGMRRVNKCDRLADELILGGIDAKRHEFPHMAMIGYGEKPDVKWLCGGSIISENFILTAGHCISARNEGDASFVAVRIYNTSEIDVADDSKIFKVKRIVRHPNHKPPAKYNDIALIEIDRPLKLDQHTLPACLDTGNSQNDNRTIATGWGLRVDRKTKASSENLEKITLTKFSQQECEDKYQISRHLKNGLDHSTQICYGDKSMSKDTCMGGTGGPLQIKSRAVSCMYIVVGVASFGRVCGLSGDPDVFTRVSAYVPWIESVVWP